MSAETQIDVAKRAIRYATSRQDVKDALYLMRRVEQRWNCKWSGDHLNLPLGAQTAYENVMCNLIHLSRLLEVLE